MRLNRFPAEVPYPDMIAYFTLSPSDRRPVPKTSAPANRLGFALQLGALRYLGFCPKDVATAPRPVVAYVAEQLGTPADCLTDYGARSHTRTDHALLAQSHLGFRKATEAELDELGTWLVARALEHDRPLLLLELACERLRRAQLIRPDLQMLERLVVRTALRFLRLRVGAAGQGPALRVGLDPEGRHREEGGHASARAARRPVRGRADGRATGRPVALAPDLPALRPPARRFRGRVHDRRVTGRPGSC